MVYGPTVALDEVSLTIRSGEIHSLLGRNGAGKSTLVGILAGVVSPTAGVINYDQDVTRDADNVFARRQHVGTVFQHSMLIPHLTVAENMALGDLPHRRGAVKWGENRRRTRALLDEWKLDVAESARVSSLSVGERQLVEIVRELSRGAQFVILDEPTSRLTAGEIDRLHSHVRRAKAQGVTFLYISHHLSEVMELSDTASVLKDGRLVASRVIASTTAEQLIGDMVGDVDFAASAISHRTTANRQDGLTVRDLRLGDVVVNELDVPRGSMVGIAGLVGSGKEIVADVLSGTAIADAVAIQVCGDAIRIRDEAQAIRAGISFVPSDRHKSGLVLSLGVGENMTLTTRAELSSRLGFISRGRVNQRAEELGAEVGLKAASVTQETRHLSGGNQQKAVLARALASDPKVLVLVNPTTGVDVASKATIYSVIAERQAHGMAVVMISDELQEYDGCDRVVVLFEGKVTKVFERPWNAGELLAAIEGVGQ